MNRLFVVVYGFLSLTSMADTVPVFIVAGQSNAGELTTQTQFVSNAYIAQTGVLWRINTNAWSASPPSVWGANLSFGTEQREYRAQRIAVYTCYSNGAVLASDYATNGAAWRDLTNGIARAIADLPASGATGLLKAVYWIQGEGDANSTNANNYQTNLTNFAARLRSSVNSNIAFRIVRIGALPLTTRPYAPTVRAAQTNAAVLLGDSWVDSDSCPKQTTSSSDYIHYDAYGCTILGLRMSRDAESVP